MDGTSPWSLVYLTRLSWAKKPTKVSKTIFLLWSKQPMALVNTGPTYPSIPSSIHPFVFLSVCNQCSFAKANPFSSDAWNDCINPLAGTLQPNQTKPNPSFLLHFSTPLGLLSLAEETPPFPFSFFFFVLCNRWWPQTNKFWVHDADFGVGYFFWSSE